MTTATATADLKLMSATVTAKFVTEYSPAHWQSKWFVEKNASVQRATAVGLFVLRPTDRQCDVGFVCPCCHGDTRFLGESNDTTCTKCGAWVRFIAIRDIKLVIGN